MKNIYVVCSFTVYLLCIIFMGVLLLTQVNFVKQQVEELANAQEQSNGQLQEALDSIGQMETAVAQQLSWLQENREALTVMASEEETEGQALSGDIQNSKYYLRLLNGYITVFQGGSGEIKFETSISQDSLTQEQKKRLTRGIGLDSLLDVYNYLASYSS